MATENKSKYAIMGMLSLKPMSGYDVKKGIERSVGFFWNESYGQIYPILKQLAQEGFAEEQGAMPGETRGRPERRTYALTERGHAELRRWLAEPVAPTKLRDELLLKLFFAEEVSPEVAQRHLHEYRERMQAQLTVFATIESTMATLPVDDRTRTYWSLTVRNGVYFSEAAIAWADEALEQLAALAARLPTYSGATAVTDA